MSEIIRTWLCQNHRCGAEFDSWERYPCCPTCEGARVEWCPRGGHIAGVSKDADKELRALADHFKMDDINSARRDQRAKPPLVQKPMPANAPIVNFGGFAAQVDMEPSMRARRGIPACVPVANKVDVKLTTQAVSGGKGVGALPSVGQHRKVT